MKIQTFYDDVELYRNDKILYARFLVPHRVISTCQVAGGIRDDMDYLYNHQSCEPSGHHAMTSSIMAMDRPRYREFICEKYGLEAEKCATLGTAANMRFAAVKQETFRDLTVAAVCTGGVEGNAGRAGDPASHYEHEGKFEKLPEKTSQTRGHHQYHDFYQQGTHPRRPGPCHHDGHRGENRRSPGAARALPLLRRPCHRHRHRPDRGGLPHGYGNPSDQCRKTRQAGELIGRTVHDAIKETLAQQNGLFPGTRRSVSVLLERLGMTKADIRDAVRGHLDPEDAELWPKVEDVVLGDSLVVAAVAALVHIRDQMVWGIIPDNCLPEILATYGAQIAAAVSCKHEKVLTYKSCSDTAGRSLDNPSFTAFVCRMLAMGFSDKWKERMTPEED